MDLWEYIGFPITSLKVKRHILTVKGSTTYQVLRSAADCLYRRRPWRRNDPPARWLALQAPFSEIWYNTSKGKTPHSNSEPPH